MIFRHSVRERVLSISIAGRSGAAKLTGLAAENGGAASRGIGLTWVFG